MENIDIIVFISYCIVILSIGLYVSRDKSGSGKSAEDYFLAGKSLPWWTIGASLIAANISAEQFIGMSGSGFALGLAIATYEWMAAITLLVVGKFFLAEFRIDYFVDDSHASTHDPDFFLGWIEGGRFRASGPS